MSANLIQMITQGLSGPLLGQIGSLIGGSADSTTKGMAGAIPAILAGLLKNSSTPAGAGDLLNTLTRGNFDGMLGNLGGLLGGGSASQELIRNGAGLLPSIFGNKSDAITDLIGSASGLNRSSSSSLLGVLAPLALGFITKHLRGSGGLNASGLTSLLSSQRSAIAAAAPAGLGSMLGLGDLNNVSQAMPNVDVPSSGGIFKWLIPIAAILAALFLYRSCQTQRTDAPPAPVVQAAPVAVEPAPAPTPVAAATDGLVDLALPDGTTLRVAADGLEGKLVGFITDGTRAVDKDTWFTMSGLEFETGSATLSAKSNAQLDAVTATLKAFPAVKLKIGGYTDNTGNAAANMKLSGERAAATVAALVSRGVDAARLAGEGDQHPVADNATEEGRQRNRRIDVRVTAK
jgi:OmpA-OmpF porin, OOP family